MEIKGEELNTSFLENTSYWLSLLETKYIFSMPSVEWIMTTINKELLSLFDILAV